jgi:predicted transcriptional regulator
VKQHHALAQTVLTCQQQHENTQVTTENEYKKSQKVHTCHTYLIPNDQQSPVFLALSRGSMQN